MVLSFENDHHLTEYNETMDVSVYDNHSKYRVTDSTAENIRSDVHISTPSRCCSFLYLFRPSLSLTPSLTSDLILAEGKEMVWAGLKWCGHRWEAQVLLEVQVFLSVFEPEGGLCRTQESNINSGHSSST